MQGNAMKGAMRRGRLAEGGQRAVRGGPLAPGPQSLNEPPSGVFRWYEHVGTLIHTLDDCLHQRRTQRNARLA